MSKVAIIGGGLAGTACAYVLKKAGADPVIYEAEDTLASGASGNNLGLYNPRLSAKRTPESEYYVSGFSLALRTFASFKDIDWNPCGSLHLITDEKRAKRYEQTQKNWHWDFDHMSLMAKSESQDIAGVDVNYEALYLPDAGYVSPQKLCAAYAQDVEVNLSSPIETLPDADTIILACGMGVQNFVNLPLKAVRGQVTEVKANGNTEKLKCNLCYGGYISLAHEGKHIVGSTFQRWLDHNEIINEDDEGNIAKLAEVVPELAKGLEVIGQRASVRTTSPDHFPMVGVIPEQDNLYASTAHGSHGIISSIMAAHLLADMILDRPRCLPKSTIDKLGPGRFLV